MSEPLSPQQTEFDAFLGNMPQRLGAFTSNELPESVRTDAGDRPFLKDYSPASLPEVERFLLSRFASPEEVAQPGNQGFSEGLIRYLGETLMRATGGGWAYEPQTSKGHGLPHIQADGEHGLLTGESVSLLGMILQAVRLRTGTVFLETLEHVRGSFAPGRPTRSTSGLGVGARTRAEERFLAAWNAALPSHTVAWISAQAEPDSWDFGRASLERLGRQLRARFEDGGELRAAREDAWVTGALCYVGQAMLRATSGRAIWAWGDPSRLEADDPRTAQPYTVIRPDSTGQDGPFVVPFALLRATLAGQDEALTRAWDTMAAETANLFPEDS